MEKTPYDPMDERFVCCLPAIRFVKSMIATKKVASLASKAKKTKQVFACHAHCAYCKRKWVTIFDYKSDSWSTPATPDSPLKTAN